MIRASMAVAALALMGIAHAQDDAAGGKPPCENFPWSMDREKAAFAATPADAASGSSLSALPTGAVKLALKPLASAGLPVQPSRPPKEAEKATAGFVTLPAVTAGTYEITVNGGGVWIDPVQDNAAIHSSAHAGDKTCRLFRKSVKFDLKAGPVTLDFIGHEDSVIFTILPAQ